MKSEARQEGNETAAVFDGYKARITEVLEKERQRLMKDSERESAKTIAEARQTAQSIISQAEARAKQEAKERTRRAADRILAEAGESSAKTIAEARHDAATELSKAVADTGLEAEMLVKTRTEAAKTAAEETLRSAAGLRQKAEEESAELKEKAVLEAGLIVKDARDLAMKKAVETEHGILAEAEQRARVMIGEAWRKASDILEVAVMAADEAIERLAGTAQKTSETNREGSAFVSPDAPPSAPREAAASEDQDELFLGSVELEIAAGAGEAEMTRWIAMLRKVPGLRVLSIQNAAPGSAGRFLILNDAPTPLIGILKAMPLVDDAVRQDAKVVVKLSDGSR